MTDRIIISRGTNKATTTNINAKTLYGSVSPVTTEAILSHSSSSSGKFVTVIIYVTDSACQTGKIQTKTNLTQIYKNMPLDSYQHLRTVGALFTEKKGNIYQYLQQ